MNFGLKSPIQIQLIQTVGTLFGKKVKFFGVVNMDELEKLKQENENLKATIKQLRQQLMAYQNQTRRRHDMDYDYIPYHEDDRD